LLACSALTREICWCVARSPNRIDPVFIEKGAHNQPDRLRERLQRVINETPAEEYDRILLAYSLCGRATDGLTARNLPVIIPRAHDCATLLIGSREAFLRCFGDQLSRPWTSASYAERNSGGDFSAPNALWTNGEPDFTELAARYGEEGAQVVLDALRQYRTEDGELWFIDVPETSHPAVVQALEAAAVQKGLVLKRIPGNISLLQRLVDGPWAPEDYLVLEPGCRIEALFDHEQVIRAVPESAP